ncbi:putative pectinesterase inhibitor domain-containing protein [Helianthus anomalus]
MPSLSFSKIFLVFSVVSVTVISNAEFVDDVCKKLGNEQFCLAVLKSDSRSKFAKDITTLTTIAVDVASKNTTATRDYFLSVKTGPPAVLTSLKDCIDSYNVVIADFRNCLKEQDCSLAGYDIHDAGDEVKRCQAITDSNGAHDSFITTSNSVTLDFCGLGESLVSLMCDKRGA